MKRRRIIPLVFFAAALALFWGGMLVTAWWPKPPAQQRVYELPAADAAGVRHVVIEQFAQRNAGYRGQFSVDVVLSAQVQAIKVTAAESLTGPPLVALRREGDVLWVRELPPPPPTDERRRSRRQTTPHITKISLPAHVESVRAAALTVKVKAAQTLPKLALQGQHVDFAGGPVQVLQMLAVAQRRCDLPDAVNNESGPMEPPKRLSARVRVDAGHVQRLHIESLGGTIEIQDSATLQAAQVLTDDGTSLEIDRIDLLDRLRRQPVPAAREAELRARPAKGQRCLHSFAAPLTEAPSGG